MAKKRPVGSRQLKREDPGAHQPLALKPSMCIAIAAHPSHPSANGYAYNREAPSTEACGDPILVRVPMRHTWDDDELPLSLLPGADLNLEAVGYLVLDGVKRIRAAWNRGEVIRAMAIPLDQAEPYILANLERREAQSKRISIDFDYKSAAKAFHEAPADQRPYCLLGDAVKALRAAPLPRAEVMEVLGISLPILKEAMKLSMGWRHLGHTPQEANCREYLLPLIHRTLCSRFGKIFGRDLGNQLASRILPHLMQGLVDIARDHRTTSGKVDVPHFVRADAQLIAGHLAELVSTSGLETLVGMLRDDASGFDSDGLRSLSLIDLPGEKLAEWCRTAIFRAYWKDATPGVVIAAYTGRIPFHSARALAKEDVPFQHLALDYLLEGGEPFECRSDRAWDVLKKRYERKKEKPT